jgi:hypothetical protein
MKAASFPAAIRIRGELSQRSFLLVILELSTKPLLLAQLFSRNGLYNQAIKHQIGLCHFPNYDDFGADLCGKVSRKVTFSTVPGVNFVLQFYALLFFISQWYSRCYHPRASPVLYPEDWEDPESPPLPSLNEIQFFRTFRFFSPFFCSKMK